MSVRKAFEIKVVAWIASHLISRWAYPFTFTLSLFSAAKKS